MDDILLARMKERLARLRRVAGMAHDQRIIDLVLQTADELQADIQGIESGGSEDVTIHLETPPQT
jgi:hypothetical protein